MDVQAWASAATIIAAGAAALTLILRKFDKVDARIDTVDAKIDRVDDKVDQAREEARADTQALREEFNATITDVKTELNATITAVTTELNVKISDVKGELGEIRADLRFLTQRTFDLLAHPPRPSDRAEGE